MHRIEVFFADPKNDAESFSVKKDILSELEIQTDSVKVIKCYYLNAELSLEDTENLAKNLFADPIVQNYSIDSEAKTEADWKIEVKLNSGVTDNEGNTAMLGAKDLLKRNFSENEEIRTSKKYFLKGNLDEEKIKRICKELLANEVVESFEYKKLSE